MLNATIYCHSLYNKLLAQIKNVGYVPVGLGSENFSDEWLRDNTKINIVINSLINPLHVDANIERRIIRIEIRSIIFIFSNTILFINFNYFSLINSCNF